MQLKPLALAGAASLLMAGAAFAQSPNSPPSTQPSTGTSPDTTAPSSATSPAGPAGPSTVPPSSATGTDVTAPSTGSSTTTGAGTTGTTAAPSAEAAGTPTAAVTPRLVTNGPVPDTPENRSRFGGPMSHAGKRTPAKGN